MWGAVGLQPVGAGLSKLGLKVRSCTGRRRAQAPGRVRWGLGGSGCAWERPEHSSQTDSAARPPRPAYLPPLGEGVGRRVGQLSHLPRAWGGSAPGQAGSSHPGFQLGPLCPSSVHCDPGPGAQLSSSWPPLLWGALAAKRHPSSNLRLPLFAHKSLAPLLPPPPEITRHVGQIP